MWWETEKQTHLEFAYDLTALFMGSFQDLCDQIVLEELKNSIPESIATHICDQMHRCHFGDG